MTRFPNWTSRLDAFVRGQQLRSFAYGSFDCCLFVCDAIREMTGVDPAAEFRGEYRSEISARELVRRHGVHTIQRIVEQTALKHQMPEIPVMQAQRGDVMLVPRSGRWHSLGMLALDGCHVWVVAPQGLRTIPRLGCIRAWKV